MKERIPSLDHLLDSITDDQTQMVLLRPCRLFGHRDDANRLKELLDKCDPLLLKLCVVEIYIHDKEATHGPEVAAKMRFVLGLFFNHVKAQEVFSDGHFFQNVMG